MPPTAPDYPKFLKRIGYVSAGIVIGYAALGGLIAARAPRWLLFGVLVAVTVGWIVSGVLVCRSFGREERERRQGPRLTSASPRPRRATPSALIRVVGLPGLLFSAFAALGLTLTIIGAVSHVRWLLIGGVVLLIAELIDLSILWPARRARLSSTSADVTLPGTSQH